MAPLKESSGGVVWVNTRGNVKGEGGGCRTSSQSGGGGGQATNNYIYDEDDLMLRRNSQIITMVHNVSDMYFHPLGMYPQKHVDNGIGS